jgi:hypothetical protein
MSLIFKEMKWLKQTITRETTNELLKANNQYICIITNYLYKPRNALEKEGWNELVNIFKGLLAHLQELVLRKLHGGTQV